MSTRTWIMIGIAVAVILPIAWYLIAPVFRVVERDDVSPLDGLSETTAPEEQGEASPSPTPTGTVLTGMERMDAATKAEFERQMEAVKDRVKTMNESVPAGPRLVAQADFVARAHDVEGRALLIEADGKRILRFEDFKTINGPRLNIYLSSDFSNQDFVDLGLIRATKGNVNYEIPSSVDTTKYNKVLVWCVAFGVLFSSAELQ